jgi:hypothetical protein
MTLSFLIEEAVKVGKTVKLANRPLATIVSLRSRR